MAAAVVLNVQAQAHNSLASSWNLERHNTDFKTSRLAALPAEIRDDYDRICELPALQKLNEGDFDELTFDELDELWNSLGREDHEGRIKLEKVRWVLRIFMDPTCTCAEAELLLNEFVMNGCDDDLSRDQLLLTDREIFEVLTKGPGLEKFMHARAKNPTALENMKVTREEFLESVVDRVNRDDAFISLPITLLYILLFIYLVMGHLRIYDRQLMEKSLEAYTNGRDLPIEADKNIDDMASFWEWLEGDAGLAGPLNFAALGTNGFWQCTLITRNVLIGDVRLTKMMFDGSEESEWLLHSSMAKAHLAISGNEHNYREAALLAAATLQDGTWTNNEISALTMSFATYNNMAHMFALTTVYVPLGRHSDVLLVINVDAVSINPYYKWDLYIADGVFLILILYIISMESIDLIAASRLGFGEFLDYWEIWNVVDWISIVLGLISFVLWIGVVSAMQRKEIRDLLDNDNRLIKDVMALDQSELEKLFDCLASLRSWFLGLQAVMALNVISIVLKFFKAFESNDRLEVVTRTFEAAGLDLAHFFIIFLTMFLPFTIVGHILFGHDIVEFGSVFAAMNTGIQALMGECGWYADLQAPHMFYLLPSGMPVLVLSLWYFLYMFMMVLVILNMLLAIVLDHYTGITAALHQKADTPALWEQVRRYVRDYKKMRKWIHLKKIRLLMENDDDQAHPDEKVTLDSIQDAFADLNMQRKQAVWLIKWLYDQHEKKQTAEADSKKETKSLVLESKARLEDVHKMCINQSLAILGDNMPLSNAMAHLQPLAPKRKKPGFKAASFVALKSTHKQRLRKLASRSEGSATGHMPATMASIASQLDEVNKGLSSLREEQAQLKRAVQGARGKIQMDNNVVSQPLHDNQGASKFKVREVMPEQSPNGMSALRLPGDSPAKPPAVTLKLAGKKNKAGSGTKKVSPRSQAGAKVQRGPTGGEPPSLLC